jgi:hypothetical protein
MFDWIHEGEMDAAWRVLIYGEGGVGKSSLAAKMSKPLFVEGEAGGIRLNVPHMIFDKRDNRMHPQSWEELNGRVDEIATAAEAKKKLPFETLVLDGFSAMEQLCVAHVCKKNNWPALSAAGYGKGEVAHYAEMRVFLRKIERIWASHEAGARGINVAFICHVAEARYADNETGAEYKRQVPGLTTAKNADVSGMFYGWCDAVLYCEKQITIGKNAETKRTYGVGGEHVMHTKLSAGHLAKCRLGSVDETLPLDWNEFVSQIGRSKSPELMQKHVMELAGKAPEEAQKQLEAFKKTAAWKDLAELGKWASWLQQAA